MHLATVLTGRHYCGIVSGVSKNPPMEVTMYTYDEMATALVQAGVSQGDIAHDPGGEWAARVHGIGISQLREGKYLTERVKPGYAPAAGWSPVGHATLDGAVAYITRGVR